MRSAAVLALALLRFGPLAAQQPEEAGSDPERGTPAGGAWHAALEAHAALRDQHVLRVVDAELVLGRHDRALMLLERHRITTPELEGERAVLDAAGAFGSGDYARAAALFVLAAFGPEGRAAGRSWPGPGTRSSARGPAIRPPPTTPRRAIPFPPLRRGLPCVKPGCTGIPPSRSA
jgi:hypothetical protein